MSVVQNAIKKASDYEFAHVVHIRLYKNAKPAIAKFNLDRNPYDRLLERRIRSSRFVFASWKISGNDLEAAKDKHPI
ncbi:hypothetical protein [Fibrobacter succinogenes]|uniref:hypothetical protein n=1 Tax=Fibrobacter succinogenes TaxID=833 RepID=UPI0015655C09|nr:hypothetical protein [Fibrobacter succinogenes]